MGREPRVRLAGTLAVVTGAGSGIGRDTASARGGRAVALDVAGEQAEETASARGGRAVALDVADRGAVAAAVHDTLAARGVPDVLVDNAGMGMTGRFLDMEMADWHGTGAGVSVICPGVTATSILSSNTRYLGGQARPDAGRAPRRRSLEGSHPPGSLPR